MKYEIKKYDAGGRLGLIKHNNKKLPTPNIFPVVSPFYNLIPPQDIVDVFGGNAVFTNAFILFKNKQKRMQVLEHGIHNSIKFSGLIATDSGAFQKYMYGDDLNISANQIEEFQEKIRSDFPVILDSPVQLEDSKEKAREKIIETISRAKNNIKRRKLDSCSWVGPIHGSQYLDLIKFSCIEMNKLHFGIYALGGLVKTFNNYMFDISINALLTAKRYIRPDIPIHLFGAGLPQFMSLSVACGADLMDSAAYILFAKEGRYMTLEGTQDIIQLKETTCNCPICSSYSARELKKLYKKSKKSKKSEKGIELLARHNLYVTFGELRAIREAIRQGKLWELVESRIHAHPKLLKAYSKIPKYWEQLEKLEAIENTQAVSI
ncbi:MAG: tRNA guanosine(15) transglycosylase TgtA, partial [Candidatus Lokiarchaeota archaeon]|nr:tRNA guanosine(15) transglycosylase TgtA [Candidatus Lokiarchaeota archaeon]